MRYLDPRRDSPLRRTALWAMSSARQPPMGDVLDAARSAEMLEFARRNRIGPVVAHAVVDAQVVEGQLLRAWETEHAEGAARIDTLMRTLDRIAGALASEGIVAVGLKNTGIARGIYPCRACCPMGDLDILVDRARFVDAHHVLVGLGFRHTTTAPDTDPANLRKSLEEGGSEYQLSVDGVDVLIDLQWRVVAGRWLRKDQEIDTTEALDQSVAIPDTDIRLLNPTDNMFQVAVHTAKHAYCRAPGLRLHTDVDRLAVHSNPDWAGVVRRAEQFECRTSVYFSLAIAAQLLGSAIPADVLAELAPPRLQIVAVAQMLRRFDIFEPNETKGSRASMIAFYALLHDSPTRLAATVLDTDPSQMTLRNLPRTAAAGAARVKYFLFRRSGTSQ